YKAVDRLAVFVAGRVCDALRIEAELLSVEIMDISAAARHQAPEVPIFFQHEYPDCSRATVGRDGKR
ncbi:hypothetical protein, partial [Pseudomonas syringae]|uniref:hypothetical protein n=1 Tax=Pseudomonas syringae TaxID=317 RepID=UPI001F368AB7